MAERIPNGVAKLVVFKAFLSADHVTPATGKTIVMTISKNGGAFGNPNAGATNATEISSGFYKFTLDTTDTGTNGPLAWRGAVASIDDVGDVCEVVAATNGGFTALPAVAAGSNGGVPLVGTQVPNATAGAAGGLFIAGSNAALTVASYTITGAMSINGTGNVAQTGDSYGRIGANGAGLTSLAPASTALSTAVWTAPPTGFLAATFPGTVASPTNITAGVITTVTNLTNLPSIPANWLTAVGITAGALNGKGDWMVSYAQPAGFLAATFPGTVASPTNITAGVITTVTNLTNAPSAGDLTATMKTSVQTAADAAVTANSSINSIGTLATGIKAKTDNLPASPASTTNITAGTITTTTNLTNAPTAGDLTATMKASVQTAAGAAVTANAVVTGIKTQTDKLTFTVPNKVDSNITHVISDPIQVSGNASTNWGGAP